jgi:hypothetical protein
MRMFLATILLFILPKLKSIKVSKFIRNEQQSPNPQLVGGGTATEYESKPVLF